MPLCEIAGVVGGPGQAEVGDLHLRCAPPSSRTFARLDVAVDQVARVGGGQSLGDLPADPQHLGHVRAGRCGRVAAGASRRG